MILLLIFMAVGLVYIFGTEVGEAVGRSRRAARIESRLAVLRDIEAIPNTDDRRWLLAHNRVAVNPDLADLADPDLRARIRLP